MKKEPTKRDIAMILLTGLGCMSFGLLLIWVPVLGVMLLLLGALMVLLAILTILTIFIKIKWKPLEMKRR